MVARRARRERYRTLCHRWQPKAVRRWGEYETNSPIVLVSIAHLAKYSSQPFRLDLIRKTKLYGRRFAHRGTWVEPSLLAEIEYRAKSAEGKVRHPVFKGLREDL